MSDPIDRQAAIEAVERSKTVRSADGEIYCAKINAQMNIQLLPSAQPEIIHCRDCKYYTPVTARCEVRGKGLYLIRNMEDFCSRAERTEHE